MQYFLLGMLVGVIGLAGMTPYRALRDKRKFTVIVVYSIISPALVLGYFYDDRLLQETDSLTLLTLLIIAVTLVNNENVPLRPKENKVIHILAVLIVTTVTLVVVYMLPFYNTTWGLLLAAACMCIGPPFIHTLTLLSVTALVSFLI